MTPLRDLLDLPPSVRKGDFVQALAAGIQHPRETVECYALTPALLESFHKALSIIGAAVKTGRSQAAFLHGSFGAGKSHFLAVLDLLLANNPDAWARGEFHAFRNDHAWIEGAKVLQLPMVLTEAESIEGRVFQAYIHWLRDNHPDAPVPALFRDVELFDNAVSFRDTMGAPAFFARLNHSSADADGWGDIAAEEEWTAETFTAAMRSGDPEVRGRLFSALVRTVFPAFAAANHAWLDFDKGLEVLSQHAARLGYSAVVLYLDELFLWLGGQTSNLPFIQREVQKLAKLKEAQNEQRSIPIVGFISRQRDLSQFLGSEARGVDHATLDDSLNFNSGRFEEIILADSNLPAIVERRVVRPKDDAARDRLRGAFEKAWRGAGAARTTLIGTEGDEAAFRLVYPFSPALVEALVALADCLQRERTAIRLLMELLVDHVPDLDVDSGQIVPVGDVFDAIAGGEDAFDQVMKGRFDKARALYAEHFLPIIRRANQTESPEACQRLRADHPRRLGCSRCPKTACRNDNRLAKSALLSALVPGAGPFKGLTVKRLVHLNSGRIGAPVPGTEAQIAAQKLRIWASEIGALRVGDEADPSVTIRLDGVDLDPIRAKASEHNNPGNRKTTLRRLLFEALALPADSNTRDHTAVFGNTKRDGFVRFGNVREMSDSTFRLPTGKQWQIVIDYPFDESGHGPAEDLRRVENFRDGPGAALPDNTSLVWLPTFFSAQLERTLGDLVVLEEISRPGATYLSHLRPDDQARAKQEVGSLVSQKQDAVRSALSRAYGVATPIAGDGALDGSRSVDEHFFSLLPGHNVRGIIAPNLQIALERLVEELLIARYPHHPRYNEPVTTGKLDKIRGTIEKLLEAPGHRLNIAPAERKELQNIGDPLGIIQTTESAVLLQDGPFQRMEAERLRKAEERPSVRDARLYADPEDKRGLQRDASDLLVWLYALWSGRTLRRDDRTIEMPKLGTFGDELELARPELPTEDEWTRAITNAGHLFGLIPAGRFRSARNVSAFEAKLVETIRAATAARTLAAALSPRTTEWCEASENSERLRTALSVASLLDSLMALSGAAFFRSLAGAQVETSLAAGGKSIATAQAVQGALNANERWLNFESVRQLVGHASKGVLATALLADLQMLLVADEVNKPLVAGLDLLGRRAAEILRPPRRGDWKDVAEKDRTMEGTEDWEGQLARLVTELREVQLKSGSAVRLRVSAVIQQKDSDER